MQTFKIQRARPKYGLYLTIALVLGGLTWLGNSLTGTLENVQRKLSQNEFMTDSVEKTREAETQEVPKKESKAPSPFRAATDTASLNRGQPSQPNQTTEPSTTAEKLAPAGSAEKITNQIRVEFALISKESLEKMNLASAGQPSSNLVTKNKYEEVMKDAANQNLASETHTVSAGQSTTVIQGGQLRTRENIGFNLRVSMAKSSDTTADLRIDIIRSLPLIAPTGEVKVASSEFHETVNINGGQTFAISGLLPRKNIMPNEDQLYATNVLRALLDPAFQKFDQEFVIFVSPF